LQPALAAGEVQVVPEYLGTFAEFLNTLANGADAPSVANNNVERTLTASRELAEPLGITLQEPSPAEDVNAFAVTADFARENSIATLSDLAGWSQGNALRLGAPPECPQRPFCQRGLESAYGMQFADFVPLDAGGPLTKQALDEGSIDLGLVFSSDGSVEELDLVVLEDDLGLQNVDNIVPAVLSTVAVPQVVDALNALSAVMTTEDLVSMNKAVDIDRRTVSEVAAEYLTAKGLG
jgi:osmoprotectant transport system substrate-binding protein